MILISWSRGSVVLDGDAVTPMPSDTAPAVDRVLKRSATVQRSFEIPGGGVEERMIRLAPGEPGHRRAALLSLPGAVVTLDDD